MNILKPVDIEKEVKTALADHMQTYLRPLPATYTLPNILITATGGASSNTIDTFQVTLDARGETDADAYDLLRNALGVLQQQGANQSGALRNVSINSLARWGNDPVRPDLKLCTATVLITAHREPATIPEI